MLRKIISGGQTGVDRAALDVALDLKIPCGGWCPQDRKAEDGPISAKYPLCETPLEDYAQRTACNVRDADGTLILTEGSLTGGTALTVAEAKRLNKPLLILNLNEHHPENTVKDWLERHGVSILNIAGPRESEVNGIYACTKVFLTQSLR